MDHKANGISTSSVAADIDSRPNRPVVQHSNAVDVRPVSVQPKDSQPQVSE